MTMTCRRQCRYGWAVGYILDFEKQSMDPILAPVLVSICCPPNTDFQESYLQEGSMFFLTTSRRGATLLKNIQDLFYLPVNAVTDMLMF